nr:hypothetical protein [Methylomonas koyamae]
MLGRSLARIVTGGISAGLLPTGSLPSNWFAVRSACSRLTSPTMTTMALAAT